MHPKNKVFIATTLDGYIADENGGVDWLNAIPNPEEGDMGYGALMESIDALLMGRNTFETVCGFDIEWPYQKPVFVLSNSLSAIPEKYANHATLVQGTSLTAALENLHAKGFHYLYIDGGKLIQSFLHEDLIDEMTITRIPLLLGKGIPLFGTLEAPLAFSCVRTVKYTDQLVQQHYVRVRD
jgi:dihydrofolate reductase